MSEDDGGWQETIITPTVVEDLLPEKHDGARVVQIAGGVHHSLFLLSNGQVWGCGRTDGSELGLGKDHPAIKEMKEREQEALTRRKAKEVEETERIKNAPVEDDEDGNPGQPLSDLEVMLKAQENAAQTVPLPNPYIPAPTRLTFPTEEGSNEPAKIIQIATGTRHNFGVSSTGAVYAWGFGNTAQLGLGDVEEAATPTRVVSQAMGGFKVLSAHSGGQHSVVVAQRGVGSKVSVWKDWKPAEELKKEEDPKAEANGDAQNEGEEKQEADGDAVMANDASDEKAEA